MKHDTDQKKRVIPTPKTNSQESLYKSDSQKPSCLCEPELAYAAKRQGLETRIIVAVANLALSGFFSFPIS